MEQYQAHSISSIKTYHDLYTFTVSAFSFTSEQRCSGFLCDFLFLSYNRKLQLSQEMGHLLCCVYHTVQNSISILSPKDNPFTVTLWAVLQTQTPDLICWKKGQQKALNPLFFLSVFLSHEQCQVCILKSIFPCSLFLTLRDKTDSIWQQFFYLFFQRTFWPLNTVHILFMFPNGLVLVTFCGIYYRINICTLSLNVFTIFSLLVHGWIIDKTAFHF